MDTTIGVTGCTTIAPELHQVFRELGLPTKLYSSQPACLFEAAREEIGRLIAEAAEEHDSLIVAMGTCCGTLDVEGAGIVSAARCTEMLLGSGTYGWCADHGVLTMPPPHFSTWINHPGARSVVERILTSHAAKGLRAVMAIDEHAAHPDPNGMTEIERIVGKSPGRLYTGLGHLREMLRETAERAGINVAEASPEPIAPDALGPGDDCLILRRNGDGAPEDAAEVIAHNLRRGVRCVWITGDTAPADVAAQLARHLPDADELRDSGDLTIVSAEALLAETNAADAAQILVGHWVARAADALEAGQSGLCIVHGCGWAEAAGLSSEYVLAYASRLSSACAKWPLFSISEVAADREQPSILDELTRTHPLIWSAGRVEISTRYLRPDEYLGGEDLLEALASEPVAFTCGQVAPLIAALVDGELEGPAAMAVSQHAEQCERCRQSIRRHRDTKRALSPLRKSVEDITDELWTEISRRLHEAN